MIQRRMFAFSLAVAGVMTIGGAFAATITKVVNGIQWTFTVSDGEATVGADDYYERAVPKDTTGDITVPNFLGGYPVTHIGYRAFANCGGLTSVTIQPGVKSIDLDAFLSCTNLTSVTIPDGVTRIGDGAFCYCYKLKDLAIPESVTDIESSAFNSCRELTSVVIPPSVTNIYPGSFYGCTGIRDVTIPARIASTYRLSDSTLGFYFSASVDIITNVVVSGDVTSIAQWAFRQSKSLKSVSLPPSVTNIGEYAFYGCPELTSVPLPSSLKRIEHSAFSACPKLTSVEIPLGVSSIGYAAYGGCAGMTSVTIPSSVKEIERYAFAGCTGLSSISIPSGVSRVDNYVFSGCTNLTSVTIPSSVQSIGEGAFQNCCKLPSVTLPSYLRIIYESAFKDCTALTVAVPARVEWIFGAAFAGCGEVSIAETNPNYKLVNGHVLTKDGKGYVSCVGDYTNVTIPDGVESIGYEAFSCCDGLRTIKFPLSLKSIGGNAFESCDTLTSITFPSGLTDIKDEAFSFCHGLSSVYIPASVTNIGYSAFSSCSSVANFTFGGDAPLVGSRAFDKPFGECNWTATVYEGTTGWGTGDTWQGLALRVIARFPDLGENPTRDQISEALNGAKDPKLADNITDGSNYEAYRTWAARVKNADGIEAGAQEVKNSSNAWLSFALGSANLLEEIPTGEVLHVDAFEAGTEPGKFEFTVSVKDIEIGSDASAENLAKVFGIEGGTSPDSLSSSNVDVVFGVPSDGKVKFTAGPKVPETTAFFMKVMMTP